MALNVPVAPLPVPETTVAVPAVIVAGPDVPRRFVQLVPEKLEGSAQKTAPDVTGKVGADGAAEDADGDLE